MSHLLAPGVQSNARDKVQRAYCAGIHRVAGAEGISQGWAGAVKRQLVATQYADTQRLSNPIAHLTAQSLGGRYIEESLAGDICKLFVSSR